MTSNPVVPRLYTDFAKWWDVFSPPSHYVEEAADLLPTILGATDPPPKTLLELGCGAGSLAFHFKPHLRLTLTDVSAPMLELSRGVNPECEHLLGDMRSIDVGREFDVVFIHDAIMYLTDESSVRAALGTASRHCRPGGAVVVVPDFVRETFAPQTTTGGDDAPDGRALRYMEWTWDPDPADQTVEVAYAFLMREASGVVHADSDRQLRGIFGRADWLEWLGDAGLSARSRIDPWDRDVFVGAKG
jgi:ubiquinone/menaquinone biosynthesis C-methylase UbiE